MSDDETVERVARIIADKDYGRVWNDLTDFGRAHYCNVARAALSAMPERELLREALEALSRIHSELDEYVTDNDGEVGVCIAIAFEVARAAADKIRAALEHQQKGEGL